MLEHTSASQQTPLERLSAEKLSFSLHVSGHIVKWQIWQFYDITFTLVMKLAFKKLLKSCIDIVP